MHSWRPPPSSRPEAGDVAWALGQLLLLLRGNVGAGEVNKTSMRLFHVQCHTSGGVLFWFFQVTMTR